MQNNSGDYHGNGLVQFSHSVISKSLQPHGLQHTRFPCPSPSLRACANSCPVEAVMPSNHLIFYHPLLLLPSIFPSIRVFSTESVLSSRGQSIGASAPALVFPMNIQDWYPLGLIGLISLLTKGLSRVQKYQFFRVQPSLWSNFNIHIWKLEKIHSFYYMNLSHQSNVSEF